MKKNQCWMLSKTMSFKVAALAEAIALSSGTRRLFSNSKGSGDCRHSRFSHLSLLHVSEFYSILRIHILIKRPVNIVNTVSMPLCQTYN